MTDVSCIVCGSRRWRLRHRGMHDLEYGLALPALDIVECPDCGLLRLDPMPAPETLLTFYTPDYANTRLATERSLRSRLAGLYDRRLIRRFAQLAGPAAAVLDVGCSAGHLVAKMQAAMPGWTVTGVETDASAVAAGRALGRNIVLGGLDEAPLRAGSFDLVVLNHVVEHVADPRALLARVLELLKPGGHAYIEMPNTACLDFRLLGRWWGGIHFPRHTYLFSGANAAILLEGVGFAGIAIENTPQIFGWAMGWQNWLADKAGLSVKGGRSAIYPALMLAALPLVLLQDRLGATASMAAVAHKPV
ncbi:MAG: class I SAM-dependent methyltransferase [Magnetospirillum sp. WYHS-4]